MGEFELLARMRERMPAAGRRVHLGSGDDAAVTVPGGATATSVDALVDGIHFRREDASPAQIGHKALATALSDLAAMGAEAGEAYVAIGLPEDFGEDACIELLDGMLALAAATGTSLAGGDLTRSPVLFLTLTVVGHAQQAEGLVRRRGARPGDALVVTGELGGAAAGLALLDAEARVDPPTGGSALAPTLIERQLRPQPRLAAGQALARVGATAMIDVSDGLGGDAEHVAAASEVRLHIDGETLPRAPGLDELAAELNQDPWQLLINGGEDYELLASVPRELLKQATEAVREAEGIALTAIGEVVTGAGVEIRLPGGGLAEPGGFDQLA